MIIREIVEFTEDNPVVVKEDINGDIVEKRYIGYQLKCDWNPQSDFKSTLSILISADYDCCEFFGYLVSGNPEEFIGAKIRSVQRVHDTEAGWISTEIPLHEGLESDQDRSTYSVFINVQTDKGNLQFTVYNNHNGYYGHDVIVRYGSFNLRETI